MRKLLVLDDDEEITELCRTVLSERHQVHSFNEPKEALDAASSLRFDLIITDINMPSINGFQFINKVSMLWKNGNTPFIFVSASAKHPHVARAAKLGATSYLLKPLSAEKLALKVDEVLKQRKEIEEKFVKEEADIEVYTNLTVNMKIESVDEFGMFVISPVPFVLNSSVNLQFKLFENEGVQSLHMTVSEGESIEDKWRHRLQFQDSNLKLIQKIRAYSTKYFEIS